MLAGSGLVAREGEDVQLTWSADGTEGELAVAIASLDEDGFDDEPTVHRVARCTFDVADQQGVVPSSIVSHVATGIPLGVFVWTHREEHVGIGSHDVAVTATEEVAAEMWTYATAPCGTCDGAAQIVCNPACGSDCDDIVCADGTSTPPPMLEMGTTLVQVPAVTEPDPRCAGVFPAPAVAWAVVLEVPPEARCVSIVPPAGVCGHIGDDPLEASPGFCSEGPTGRAAGFGDEPPRRRFVSLGVQEGRTVEPGIVRIEVGADDRCPLQTSIQGCPPSFD